MTGFTLDTSGSIEVGLSYEPGYRFFEWPDLSPFAQGYVKALFAEQAARADEEAQHLGQARLFGLSDLAPETLAAILKDCERARGLIKRNGNSRYANDKAGGAAFHTDRQAGVIVQFPPLTPYLDNDGKVRLKSRGE